MERKIGRKRREREREREREMEKGRRDEYLVTNTSSRFNFPDLKKSSNTLPISASFYSKRNEIIIINN